MNGTDLIDGGLELLLGLGEVVALVLLAGQVLLRLLEQLLEVLLVARDAAHRLLLTSHLLVQRPDLRVLGLLLLLGSLQVQLDAFQLLQPVTRSINQSLHLAFGKAKRNVL